MSFFSDFVCLLFSFSVLRSVARCANEALYPLSNMVRMPHALLRLWQPQFSSVCQAFEAYAVAAIVHATHAQVLVMSVMFVGFVVLLHVYGKLTAVPDAVDEDPIMPETPGAEGA